jgi:hypothetical protein
MIARMQETWLGEIAFDNYWRVLETHCPGVVKAPEFSRMSRVEREAWVEAAKAVGEQIRDSFVLLPRSDAGTMAGNRCGLAIPCAGR